MTLSEPMYSSTTNPPALQPLHYFALFVVSWVSWSYYHGQTRKMSNIPSMGFDLPFFSYLSAIYRLFTGKQAVLDGSKRYGIFKFPELSGWTVIAGDLASIEEVRKAPDHILCPAEYQILLFHGDYTNLSATLRDAYQIPVMRDTMTQALPLLAGEIFDELKIAAKKFLPQSTTDWTPVSMHDVSTYIVTHMTNRIVVGKEMCQNKEYIEASVGYTNEVVNVAIALHMTPSFLRPLVNRLVSNIHTMLAKNRHFLFPLFDERRRAMEEKGQTYEGKPMDIMSWFMDKATGDRAKNENLMMGLLALNFGATKTSSANFVNAIHHAAASPAYLKLLREEAEEVIGRLGWTQMALDEMPIINSFLKESLRIHPNGEVGHLRVSVQDFTFSNGLTVPKGTVVGGAISTTHFNENIYPDPYTFDPLRFVKLDESESDSPAAIPGRKKSELTTVGTDFLTFGYGRHACPGRFLAAMELKFMLAYFVMNYDMKFKDEGVRPRDLSLGLSMAPNAFAKVLLRKRTV